MAASGLMRMTKAVLIDVVQELDMACLAGSKNHMVEAILYRARFLRGLARLHRDGADTKG